MPDHAAGAAATVPPDDGPPDDGPVVCCDLDGVIWRGDDPIPGSADGVARLRAAGLRVAFLSNNSSATVDDVVAKLARCGVATGRETVLTSAVAAAHLLAEDLGAGARVLACAGPGVVQALEAAGFVVVREPPAAAVVVGWHRDFDFAGLDRASQRGTRRARASSPPTSTRRIPSREVSSLARARSSPRSPPRPGTRPRWRASRSRPPSALVHRRFGRHGVMVGDRPSTDGAMADALGWPFALVLSGVASATPAGGGEPIPSPPPTVRRRRPGRPRAPPRGRAGGGARRRRRRSLRAA